MAKQVQGARKRADGKLEKRFTIDGKRYSVYGRSNKELAKKELELRKKIDAGSYKKNKTIILDEYFEEWKKRKSASVKTNTIRTYNNFYKTYIADTLGKCKVRELEKRQCQKWFDNLDSEFSANTKNTALRVLKAMLNDAVSDEILEKNPASSIRLCKADKVKASETIHRALTEQEQRDFMQEMKSDFFYEYTALALCTGMRTGELSALSWKDIDLKKNVIHVRHSVTFTEDGKIIIGTTKSDKSNRDIPITETIKEILDSQKKKCMLVRSSLDTDNIVDFENRVFCTCYGNIVRDGVINSAIAKTLERLENQGKHIDKICCHAFRDTFATRFIEQGGNPQTLKALLGHSSLAMTMDLYAHVMPNTKHDEMSRMKVII